MSVAKAYAKALFETSSKDSAAEIEKQLDEVIAMLSASKEARVALVSPITTSKDKAKAVEALANKMNLSPQVTRFLCLLASKGRFGALHEVRESFSEVRLAAEGGISGLLVSAEPMQDAEVQGLSEAFSKKIGKKVEFRVSTDPSLLAGVKVTVGGVTYDGTLRSQLIQLRDRFVSGAAHS